MSKTLSMLIGGDCGPVHGPKDGFPIKGYTELVQPVLDSVDMRFVNCMRTYSDRGETLDSQPHVRQPIEMADIFSNGRFDAVTLANNHTYDSGPEAMLNTRVLFNSRGIQTTGVGRDLTEACQPAIIEKDGVTVAYLGKSSVSRPGSEAGKDKPGIATIRTSVSYETRGENELVRIKTEPDPADLEMLQEEIRALKRKVDIVVLAYHAGVIRVPRVIPDYQVAVAHAAVDAGADLVVSHSPHIPKGIEVYKGKAIFYSIGVFAMTKTFAAPSWAAPAWVQGAIRGCTDLDPEYPFMPYGKDCTKSLLVKATFGKGGIQRVSFLPVKINKRYCPEVLSSGNPGFREIVDYMEWVSVDLPHQFSMEGDEVVVT